jgi:hypothetical protein
MSYEAFTKLLNILALDLTINGTKSRNQTSNQPPIGAELSLHYSLTNTWLLLSAVFFCGKYLKLLRMFFFKGNVGSTAMEAFFVGAILSIFHYILNKFIKPIL